MFHSCDVPLMWLQQKQQSEGLRRAGEDIKGMRNELAVFKVKRRRLSFVTLIFNVDLYIIVAPTPMLRPQVYAS